MTEKTDKPAGKSKNILRIIVFLVCLTGFVVCAVIIWRIQTERRTARDAYSGLRQETQSTAVYKADTAGKTEAAAADAPAAEEPVKEPSQLHSMDFDVLREMSEDIVGWILAEGTNVDYPVLQAEDNDKYLHTLYNGEYNDSGSIFMDCRNTRPASDRNIVLYGHHMADGSMFQSLMLYKNADFYEDHRTMNYYAPEGDYIVELISGTVEDADAETEFLRFSFDDDADLQSYVDSFRERSTFVSDVTLQPGDRIISLCTCSYEKTNARYLIIGRLVPVME